jgi:hypothetical protein
MKLWISVMTAVGLGFIGTALAEHYSDLAAQGYRWVTSMGPMLAAVNKTFNELSVPHTDETELHMAEDIRCYYLIPGTIVQVIKEDPATGMLEMRLGDVSRSLWTYTRFLSKHPVRDAYGIIETPENSGLMPNADTAVIPFPSDR